jgi:hypothetical protein
MVLLGNLEVLKQRLAPLRDAGIARLVGAIGHVAERIRKVAENLRTLKKVRLTTYVRDRKMVDLSGEPDAIARATGDASQGWVPGQS